MKFQYTQGRLKPIPDEELRPKNYTGHPDNEHDIKIYLDKLKEWETYEKLVMKTEGYTADPSDWKEGEIMEEGEFVLVRQAVNNLYSMKHWHDVDEKTYELTFPHLRRIIARRVKKPMSNPNNPLKPLNPVQWMDKAVKSLYLQVPSEVADSVREIWEDAKEYLSRPDAAEGVKEESEKELKLIRWANAGYPPIDLNAECSAVVELIKAFKALAASQPRADVHEEVRTWRSIWAQAYKMGQLDFQKEMRKQFTITRK